MSGMWDDLTRVRNYWDNFLEFKECKHSLLFHKDIKISREWILLDLGCGMGRLSKLICNSIKEYHGVDISGESIKEAEKRCSGISNVKFYKNNGKDLRMFEDNFFDVVTIETVFQHTGKISIESYIKEIFRVLKKGGFFVANFPKLEFYGYGYTEEELKGLLEKFSWKFLKYDEYWKDDAYYYIYAEKVG